MKNLFDFADEDLSKLNLEQNLKENKQNTQNLNNNFSQEDVERDAKNLYEKYKNYSQDELLNEFITTSKTKLNSGVLTKDKINNTVNSLAPFLNEAQNEYLKGLIKKLDD